MHMSNLQKKICDQEVSEIIRKGAVVEVGSQGFVSGFFLVPKSDGSWRPIINLKGLNSFLVYRHFKMEGLNNARHLVKPGCWMEKIDLKDAYFTVPLHQVDRHLLQFRWEGELWQFTCMAFGLASAPWTFTKLVQPIVTWLRARGIKVVVYLDDFFFCAYSRESLLEHLRIAETVLDGLGSVINREKSVLIPHHSIEFIGFVIDSIAFTISLPLKKRSCIVNLCEKALLCPQFSLQDLASLLGLLSWASTVVDFAQSHYRHLQRQYNAGLVDGREDMRKRITLSPESREDLSWWVGNTFLSKGKSLFEQCPALVICSDATLSGWGAVCWGVTTAGPWESADIPKHINELELVGAFNALRSFANDLRSCSVLLKLDNTTAVSYINQLGGTRSEPLCDLALDISNWCESCKINLLATHLLGHLNGIADAKSRRKPVWSDWRLATEAFRLIAGRWMVSLDLFASSWNAQLPRFVRWLPQPGIWGINALSSSWRKLQGYAFPPFSLIKDCLSKVSREQSSLVLVCPFWQSQPWFPLLLELAVDVPLMLRPHPKLLQSSLGAQHPLCQGNSFRLTAWKLSGIALEAEAFRRTLSDSSWWERALQLTPTTRRHGTFGAAGVIGSITIPYLMI